MDYILIPQTHDDIRQLKRPFKSSSINHTQVMNGRICGDFHPLQTVFGTIDDIYNTLFIRYILEWSNLNFIFAAAFWHVSNLSESVFPQYAVYHAFIIYYQTWCRIYASVNWISIGLGNGLSSIRHQATTWTNAYLFSIEPIGTNSSEIWMKIQNFSFKKKHLKTLSVKRRTFCPGLGMS